MNLFTHPRETWSKEICLFRLGLINRDSANYPRYGQTRIYNGGCSRNGQWYDGEKVPLPRIPKNFEFHRVPCWGTAIRKKEPTGQ